MAGFRGGLVSCHHFLSSRRDRLERGPGPPYGEGQLLSAGRRTTRLEVFRTGVTQLTAQDMRVELFGNAIAANSAWCQAVAIGCDLLAWTRLLALDAHLATAEPATLRYRVLHVAARLVRGHVQ